MLTKHVHVCNPGNKKQVLITVLWFCKHAHWRLCTCQNTVRLQQKIFFFYICACYSAPSKQINNFNNQVSTRISHKQSACSYASDVITARSERSEFETLRETENENNIFICRSPWKRPNNEEIFTTSIRWITTIYHINLYYTFRLLY
jgi:hypothetical protein